LLALLYPLWQFAVTGDPFLNPYTLWWPYDRIGFGPGIGVQEGGHNLYWALNNTGFSLLAGASDLFGWPALSWIFMPFGLVAIWRNRRALLASSVLFSLVLAYMLYWIGSWVFGPRYYFEGLIGVVILTAAGICWLAGRLLPAHAPRKDRTLAWLRFGAVSLVTLFLVAANLRFYLPSRLNGLTGLYGVSASQLAPFQTPSALETTPALIIVRQQQHWREYATLLELSNPYLDTPFIFIYSRSLEDDQLVMDAFPERAAYYYYADEPYKFYLQPRVKTAP
jgi:hypothetical protein